MIFALIGVMFVLAFVAVAAVVGFVLRAVLWFILLPLRLVFGLIALPFLAVGLVLATVCVGVALLGGLLVGASVLFAVATTLAVPVLVVAGLVWLVVRATRRPAVI